MNPPLATQRILYSIARRLGSEPTGDDANLSPSKSREILEFMDQRLREAWESYDFLETTLVEERAFANDYNANATYCAGDTVWDWSSRYYYTALAPTTGGTLANTKVWQPNANPPYPRWIPWWQTNHTRIGTPFSPAWNKNPYSDQNRIPIEFLPNNDGLQFSLSPVTQTIWLQFRIPYPGIALDQWNATEIYNVGDTAFYNMDSYISLADNNVNQTPPIRPAGSSISMGMFDPSATNANWQQFRIPWVFKQFVTLAVYSDALIADGENEKAPDQLAQAYTALSSEYDKQTIQSGQFTGYSARVL